MNHDLLERIYEAYANEIRLYLYSLCGSMPQAEDLMQEVFVKALLSLKDEHTNFRAWLYKVAHNLCINEMKKSSGPGKGLVSEAAWENNGGSGMSAEAAENDILHILLREERHKRLYSCIRRLPRVQMETLLMYYFGELTTGEIASALGLSPENVRVILYRARRSLRKSLEKEGYHEL